MTLLDTKTKGKLARKGGKTAAKHPRALRITGHAAQPVAKLGLKVGGPLATHRARRRAEKVGEAARSITSTIATYGPQLGLVEPPKEKRTAPRIAAGVVIGATAVYFLEPEHGSDHRKKVLQLVA